MDISNHTQKLVFIHESDNAVCQTESKSRHISFAFNQHILAQVSTNQVRLSTG